MELWGNMGFKQVDDMTMWLIMWYSRAAYHSMLNQSENLSVAHGLRRVIETWTQ